jgi:hypothetical protein
MSMDFAAVPIDIAPVSIDFATVPIDIAPMSIDFAGNPIDFPKFPEQARAVTRRGGPAHGVGLVEIYALQ